jgi:Sec-independent protein translocase protein TatA
MSYLMQMLGLSTSELAMVVFILLLVVVAGRLPRWGEALGSYLYRRRNGGHSDAEGTASHDGTSPRKSTGTGTTSQAPPRQAPPLR